VHKKVDYQLATLLNLVAVPASKDITAGSDEKVWPLKTAKCVTDAVYKSYNLKIIHM